MTEAKIYIFFWDYVWFKLVQLVLNAICTFKIVYIVYIILHTNANSRAYKHVNFGIFQWEAPKRWSFVELLCAMDEEHPKKRIKVFTKKYDSIKLQLMTDKP